jgi:hypothetical protein
MPASADGGYTRIRPADRHWVARQHIIADPDRTTETIRSALALTNSGISTAAETR